MPAHVMPIKVRFYELDPYNHLNHASYIQYFEVARIELLSQVGYDLRAMMADGLMIVVSEIHTRFIASAQTGEELTVETEVVDLKRVSSTWRQRLLRRGVVIATQELRAAMIDLEGRPVRFPAPMIAALQPYQAGEA